MGKIIDDLIKKGFPTFCVSCKNRVRGKIIKATTFYVEKTGCERYFIYSKCPICSRTIATFIKKKLFKEIYDEFYNRK